jgi:hypothetical protein
VLGRERVERENVVFGLSEHRGDLRQPPLELADRLAQTLAGLLQRPGGEDRADQRTEQIVLVFADMAAQVTQEVDGAALPGRAEHLRQRVLEPRVRVADGELDADQAALDERRKKSRQNASVSAAPTSRPMISLRPDS